MIYYMERQGVKRGYRGVTSGYRGFEKNFVLTRTSRDTFSWSTLHIKKVEQISNFDFDVLI